MSSLKILSLSSKFSSVFSMREEQKGMFVETVPFLIHMMIMGTILFYKKSSPIKDKQLWLPDDVKARDKKLQGSLGEEVARLVLKAIKNRQKKS